MTYTVCYRNDLARSGGYRGTFQTEGAALDYARKEAARSRSFASYEVWSGTPRQPIDPVKGLEVFRGDG
jgi:hypothetical protein